MTTLKQTIENINNDLYIAYRADGTPYVTHKDQSPYQDLYMHPHNHMLPDDYRYQMIRDIISGLSEYLSDMSDDITDITDIDTYEILEYINVPTYTNDLLNWLSSRNDRYDYVDLAISMYGKQDTIIDDIRYGYIYELNEVLDLIISFISKNFDIEEDEEEEDQKEEENTTTTNHKKDKFLDVDAVFNLLKDNPVIFKN